MEFPQQKYRLFTPILEIYYLITVVNMVVELN